MAIVILAYDQLLFRPIVAWADKFRFEQTAAQQRPRSWVYDLVRRGTAGQADICAARWHGSAHVGRSASRCPRRVADRCPASSGPGRRHRLARGRPGRHRLSRCGWWSTYLRANLGLDDVVAAVRARLAHARPRRRADRAREPDLGADRRLDRPAAPGRRAGAADRAVPGGVSGQRAVSHRRRRHRVVPAQPRHLAEPADGARHAVVHPVQRHRRRQRLPDRSARGVDTLPPALLAMVAQGRSCPGSSPTTSPAR